MTKPSIVPTWDTGAVNTVAPSAGQRASGWALNATPTSGVFNHEMNLYGAWAQYVNDGAFSGPVSFDSTVAITGVTSAHNINVTGNLTTTGNVSATGDIGHGTAHEINLGPADFVLVDGASATLSRGEGSMSNTGGTNVHWMATVPLAVGTVLTSITGDVFDNVTGPTTITMRLGKTVPTVGGFVLVPGGAVSSGAGGHQLLTMTGLPVTLTTGGVYFIVFQSIGTAVSSVTMATIQFTRPV